MKARTNGVPNNFKGNGFLTGGTLIVSKGGEDVILFYRQQELADHLENSKILAALGISEDVPNVEKVAVNQPPKIQECTDACSRKQK